MSDDKKLNEVLQRSGGTPQSIDEVVIDVVRLVLTSPMRDIPDSGVAVLRDYLAQGFGAAMLASTDPKVTEILENLFNHLTRRLK